MFFQQHMLARIFTIINVFLLRFDSGPKRQDGLIRFILPTVRSSLAHLTKRDLASGNMLTSCSSWAFRRLFLRDQSSRPINFLFYPNTLSLFTKFFRAILSSKSVAGEWSKITFPKRKVGRPANDRLFALMMNKRPMTSGNPYALISQMDI
jgi:hypothetical protein